MAKYDGPGNEDLARAIDQSNDYLHDILGALEAILVILQQESRN